MKKEKPQNAGKKRGFRFGKAKVMNEEEKKVAAEAAQEEAQENAETVTEETDTAALELEKAKAQSEEYLALAQRVQADFDNYRRRNNAARQEAYEDGKRDMIEKILPVLDNMERALAAAGGDESPLKSGVEMILRSFTDTLTKEGVEAIDRMGEVFDPELENAVMRGTEDEGEPGTVCAVLQKGYKMGKRVIRHAMVKVVEG